MPDFKAALASPFKLKAPPPGQGSTETPPAGTHQAVLVAILDLGTQTETFKGEEPRDAHKVYLAWELVQEKCPGTTRGHIVGKAYTLSFHTKAALRALVKAWRGKDLADQEEFDIAILKGKSCLVTLTHSTSGDRTFANLGAISQLPKGMAVVKPSIEPIMWFIGCEEPFPDHAWLPYSYGEPLADILHRSREMMPNRPGPANGQVAKNQEPEPAETLVVEEAEAF